MYMCLCICVVSLSHPLGKTLVFVKFFASQALPHESKMENPWKDALSLELSHQASCGRVGRVYREGGISVGLCTCSFASHIHRIR